MEPWSHTSKFQYTSKFVRAVTRYSPSEYCYEIDTNASFANFLVIVDISRFIPSIIFITAIIYVGNRVVV